MRSIANATEKAERLVLPEGLDWDTVQAAVAIIEDWELRADGTATELTIRLYEVLSSTTRKMPPLFHRGALGSGG